MRSRTHRTPIRTLIAFCALLAAVTFCVTTAPKVVYSTELSETEEQTSTSLSISAEESAGDDVSSQDELEVSDTVATNDTADTSDTANTGDTVNTGDTSEASSETAEGDEEDSSVELVANSLAANSLVETYASSTGLNGIDISSHQGDPDNGGLNPATVEADFVIVKVTEGTGYVNPYWERQVELALSVNKLVGLYHYALGSSSMGDQAQYFIETIRNYDDTLIGTAILCLDWEDSSLPTSNVSDAKTWLDTVYALTGVMPLIYMNQSTANGYDWSSVYSSGYKLWLAQYLYAYYNTTEGIDGYVDDPGKGDYTYGAWGTSSTIYQYTSTGNLSGYSGFLDFNKFYGTASDWSALAASTGSYWLYQNDSWYYRNSDGSYHTGWLVTSAAVTNSSLTGSQRYFFDSDGKLVMGRLISETETGTSGWWAYARTDGVIVRGMYTASTGYVYFADNDGKLLSAGWHVSSDFGQGLQRYYIDATEHAAIPGYSSDGWDHVTLAAGYVLRGVGTYNGSTYYADNDGKLVSGWLVTSSLGQGLQRYWFENGTIPEEGVYQTGTNSWTYVLSTGYVLRGKYDTGAGYVYVADNDGALPSTSGWLVTAAYDGELQRYYIDADTHAARSGLFEVNGSYYWGMANQGYVLRGFGSANGTKAYANNDGVLQEGWLVTTGFGQGLQRYWLVHGMAPSAGLYQTGTNSWTYVLSAGYVLRGKYDTGAGYVYIADNDGALPSTTGWLVTAAYDGELQRYYIDATTHAARSGLFEVDGNYYWGMANQGYVLRGFGSANGTAAYANNDGVLQQGWLVTTGFGQGLQRYWLVNGMMPSAGLYQTGTNSWTYVLSAGYVLRGSYTTSSGHTYVANNDGLIISGLS